MTKFRCLDKVSNVELEKALRTIREFRTVSTEYPDETDEIAALCIEAELKRREEAGEWSYRRNEG